MKKLLTLFLVLVASVGTMFAWDYEHVPIGDLYYNLDATSQTAEVTYPVQGNSNNYNGLTSANIPASVTYNSVSYGVISIGKYAFQSCTGLSSVTIGNSVTSIGYGAFEYCTNLTSVTIPNSVTSIEEDAFYNCSGLTAIVVAMDNPNFCSEEGVLFSKDKTTLVAYPGGKQGAYAIPNSITSIGNSAFNYCSGLTSVTIPNSITSIGNFAFNYCGGLTSVTIPNSVTSIGERAFSYCTSLTSISVEEGNTIYDSRDNCNAIIETSTNTLIAGCNNTIIPNSVTSIGDNAFRGCSSLTSIEIPNSVKSIGSYAFYYCTGLTSVTIPNSVTSIGSYAFYYCTGLTSVTIPNSVTKIGTSAFRNCSGLTSLTCEATTPPTSRSNVFKDVDKSIPLYVPAQSEDLYKAADGWKDFTNILPLEEDTAPPCIIASGTCGAQGDNLIWELSCDSVLTISGTGEMADWTERHMPWYDRDKIYSTVSAYLPIRSVVIEEGVTSVGQYAFKNCSTIVSITLPQTLNSIGKEAFRRTAISTLTIPSYVSIIEKDAFNNCESLTSVTCYSLTPPTNTDKDRFFLASQNLIIHIPCGTKVAYMNEGNLWTGSSSWTLVEDAYEYSVIGATILREPTCGNNGTLIFQFQEQAGRFFSQWSDGNTDNPRIVNLEAGEKFAVEALYVVGTSDTVCTGYEYIENDAPIVINDDMVIGDHHFFVYTYNRPDREGLPSPTLISGRINYYDTEIVLRQQLKKINRFAPKIENIEWAYSVDADKTADAYIQSDQVDINYNQVWVRYIATTSCGETFSDTLLVKKTEPLRTSGKDFWVGLTLATSADQHITQPFIIISTQRPTTSITITNPSFPEWRLTKDLDMTLNYVLTTEDIPLQYWYPQDANTVSSIASKAGTIQPFGLHIESTHTISVVATHYMNTSMDASTILPTSSLQSQYITQDYPPYNQDNESYTTFTILATENNTIVDITPTSTTLDGHTAGTTYSITLNQGQVYYGLSQDQQSLSGTQIIARSQKKIAVFQGDILTCVPAGRQARDCLYEQAVPVDYWGTRFVVTRSLQKDANRVRVTALYDDTQIRINDYDIWVSIDKGETFEFEMSIGDLSRHYGRLRDGIPEIIHEDAAYIESSMPVVVYSYDVGNGYKAEETEEMIDGVGDPSMVWIAPINQMTRNSTFQTCYTPETQYQFLNVVTTTANCQATTLNAIIYGYSVIDKTQLLEWTPVPSNPYYSYARVQIGNESTSQYNTFRLSNPFGFIAHVYGHGEDESYAYNIGLVENVTIYGEEDHDLSDLELSEEPDIVIEPGGELNVNWWDIRAGVITIVTAGGQSGQIHNAENLANWRFFMEYKLNPFGQMASPNLWYAFAVPFEVDIETGITRAYGKKSHVPGVDFQILEYDGMLRAQTGKGWVKKDAGTLEPGTFYMIGIEGNCNRWLFEKKSDADIQGDSHVNLNQYFAGNSDNGKHNGWNGKGNSRLEYSEMDLSGIAEFIYLYNNEFGKFELTDAADIELCVGQPFFVQTDDDASFDFVHNGGTHPMPALRAPQAAKPQMHFTLTSNQMHVGTDHMYVTMHEDAATTYTIGRDVARMSMNCKTAAQLWCLSADGTELAAHDIALPETETVIPLGLFVPQNGEYLLNMSPRAADDFEVELLYNGTYAATLFADQPLAFNLNAGTTTGYSVRVRRRMPTGLNNQLQMTSDQCTKVLIDNHLYILQGARIFDAQGKVVK